MPASEDLDRIWTDVQQHLERAVPPGVYRIWFAPLEPRELSDTTLVLAAPDRSVRWLADRFERVLQTSAAAVLGPQTSVELVPSSDTAPPATRGPGRLASPAPAHVPAPQINPDYTFERFVIGEGNRLAHAAALAIAEQPGQAYNPLFLYGPPGVGKTHLLHSVAHYLHAHGGGLSVRYTTIDAFTTGFVAALHEGAIDRFKAGYRGTDVLLIDDVQFLEDKARTEEEFFHTFNALYDTGSQLVLTCDRLPRDMRALEERLLERFESGLVSDITAPDFTTRLTILRQRAHGHGLGHMATGALEVIADRVTDNVRALEGALIRVIAYHSLHQPEAPITADLATHVLDRLYPETREGPPATIRDVQQLTCEAFGLQVEELLSTSRAARISWPRQLAMYLARRHTDATLPAIGRAFGGRDHSTVLYASRRAEQRLARDASANETARQVATRLRRGDRTP